jgi:hypothetical protein
MAKVTMENRIFVAVTVGVCFSAQSARAYIDPGTGGYVYSLLAPLLIVAGAALTFAFRPVRNFFGYLLSKLRSK